MILILPLCIENNIECFKLPTCLEKRSSFCSQWLSLLALDKMIKIERLYYEQMKQIKGGGCWSKNCFAHFSTQSFHCIFIMTSMKKYREKNKTTIFPRLVSMEMAAIFDFRTLTKVHITSKPLLQMQ